MVGQRTPPCLSMHMPSVPRLEDCLLVVPQLFHALLDVRHGCVKGLHIKALRYQQSAEAPDQPQQRLRSTQSYVDRKARGRAGSWAYAYTYCTTLLLCSHASGGMQVPSCEASFWHPWGTTGCTALPQWTRPQSCDAGAHAAWASAAAGTQRPHALSCLPGAPPPLVCALTQSSRPGQIKSLPVQCL